MSNTIMLDPTAELAPAERHSARLDTLKDATIGLLDISKPRGKEFLDEIEKHLLTLGAKVKRYRKPTFARTWHLRLNQQISVECDAVIEGLAD